jgi:hypothetical protein
VPFDACSAAQRSTALLVSSVLLSETIIAGLPRIAMMASSSRITRRPDNEKSGIAARHSLLKSSITLSSRNLRPLPS